MITKARKKFLEELDDEQHYRIELPREELRYLLSLQAGVNQAPENLPDIADRILGLYPEAQLSVGNEGSRVLYVRSLMTGESMVGFVSKLDKLANEFKADEHNTVGTFPAVYRFWWD
jgi:hypothetical protein